uniref:Macro domain-containing protein n=1 Tax=Cynoglossus semilaevis TaxID=244447 RepID=A0A3P8VS44_CYNSE
MGSSDTALADAEAQLNAVTFVETVNVEDQRLLNHQTWSDLKQRLLDTYNTAKRKTVAIQVDSGKRAKVTVVGFVNPVKEVSRSLTEFLVSNTARGLLIKVSRGDICRISTDAVVNAANEELQHIGGLALALLKAAGPRLQTMSNDHIVKNGRLRPGDAVITGAADLPCKFVIHAVGPRFSDTDKTTSVSRLKLAVRESLRQAEVAKCSTVALPAISSGVFGFPLELCAEAIAKTLREFCDSPHGPRSLTEIHLVDNVGNTVTVLAKAVNKQFLDLGPTLTLPPQGGRSSRAAKR